MSDIKLNESLTSDDNMGENNFFQNINNIVNLNSDDSNINDSPIPMAFNVQTQPKAPVLTQPVLTQQIQQRLAMQTQPKQIQQRLPMQTQPKQTQLMQTQVKPSMQTQSKSTVQTQPIQTQPVVPQLSEKLVTFNDVVEQKEITPTSQQAETEINTQNLLTEIKKIKIGKFLVPKVTVLFVLVLIVIGVGLFYATKPNKSEEKKDNK